MDVYRTTCEDRIKSAIKKANETTDDIIDFVSAFIEDAGDTVTKQDMLRLLHQMERIAIDKKPTLANI